MKKYNLLVASIMQIYNSAGTLAESSIIADGYWVENGAYHFFKFEGEQDDDGFRNRIVQCIYPINLTIIKSIEIL
jgi:hypothetical protein